MAYEIPQRNVTFVDQKMVSKDGDRLTVRRCYEDGLPTVTHVYIGGWRAKEYKTTGGLDRFLKSVEAMPIKPDSHIPDVAEPGCGICGDTEQLDAIHWLKPLKEDRDLVIVAKSCCDAHGDLIEAARNASGFLTVAAVKRAAKKAAQS